MKITKSQLKQIIKEEFQSVLKEGGAFASDKEIEDILKVAIEVDPDIQSWNEFHEAARIAWNEGKMESNYEKKQHKETLYLKRKNTIKANGLVTF